MRKLKDFILQPCKNNKYILEFVLFFIKLTGNKIFIERLLKIKSERKYFESINFSPIVRGGPFKGMIYPELSSVGSELAPKIIGTYEEELLPAINYFLAHNYASIIDVGCAEGYYAIGFAIKAPHSKIYAYDIQQKALNLCKAMASLNKVTNVEFHNFCSVDTLLNFDFSSRSLIICDCEGYEKELFDVKNIENLKNCDLLIELHDNLRAGVSNTILPLFNKYHDVTILKSTVRNPSKIAELSKFTTEEQTLILSECRNGILEEGPMEWAFVKSKRS